MVMETIAAMVKDLININFIFYKNFQHTKILLIYNNEEDFLTFIKVIYFFSLTKNKAIEPITGAIANVINADW